MKKKIYLLSVLLGISFGLSGCIIPTLPDMTEEQEQLLTEYAAGLLLKYDKAFDGGLLSEEALAKAEEKEIEIQKKAEREKQLADEYIEKSKKAQEEKEKQKAEKKNKKKSNDSALEDNSTSEVSGIESVAEFSGFDNVDLNYNSCETTKSYPSGGDSFFSVDASNGNELVVAHFDISNSTDSSVDVDFFHDDIRFNLRMADGRTVESCSTLLLDDLALYKNTLGAGQSDKVVLLFEVSEGGNLDGASIVVSSGGKEEIIRLN